MASNYLFRLLNGRPKADLSVDFDTLATQAYVETQIQEIPTGSIITYALSTPPTGYLACNGAAVSRETYADLFTTIGVTWGVGNGTTTFNLPDFRGEFLRGWDAGRGVDSGRTFASYQADAFKSHTHNFYYRIEGTSGGGQTPKYGGISDGTNSSAIIATGGTETRPRNKAILYAIKY